MQTISHDAPQIRYTGRIAMLPEGARFYWPGSFAEVRFQGSRLTCGLTGNVIWGSNCLGLVLDGKLSRIPLSRDNNGKRIEIVLAENEASDEWHTALLFKQLDCSYSYTLHGFGTDGAFGAAPERERLRLEFYGDSVTSGQVVEAVDYIGRTDPPSHDSVYDNAWWSYGWQCARMLHAECHLTSQGGIAVLDDTGYFHFPEGIGMVQTWDRLCYFPEAGEYTKWDFSRFIPHAVVFAIGQNDHHDAKTNTDCLHCDEPAYRAKWKEAYKGIARGVASHYPQGTPLVFITTLIRHEKDWDEAIDELVAELAEEGFNAQRYYFRRNGDGTNGHPRIPEQTEMAEELAAFLRGALEKELEG